MEEGGVLGVMSGTVTLDPDILDTNAARSLNSAKLYDDEKLSGAFGSQYVWIPRYSDQRRTLVRGYRVRYATIFAPPKEGSYRLQFFGYGETRELPATSSAATIEADIHEISPALSGVDVTVDPLGMLIDLDFRIGIGCTAGQMVAQGGVGICLVSRDFSTALRKGTRWLISPRMPFETEDEILGLHECVNLALADIRETDLLPVAASLPYHQRSKVVRLTDIAPWLEADMILGVFAPTDWVSVTGFKPPTSGTYQLQPHTARVWPPTPGPVAMECQRRHDRGGPARPARDAPRARHAPGSRLGVRDPLGEPVPSRRYHEHPRRHHGLLDRAPARPLPVGTPTHVPVGLRVRHLWRPWLCRGRVLVHLLPAAGQHTDLPTDLPTEERRPA